MSKKSIPQNTTEEQELTLNQIVSSLAKYYNKPINKVIQHLYKEFGYGYRDVSKILGIHEQTVKDKYPKEESK
jgi:hypothetical protein